jgi:hypothetical protein
MVDLYEPLPELTLRRMVVCDLAGSCMTGTGGLVDEQFATRRCRKIIRMRWGRIGRDSQAVALKRTMRRITRKLVRKNRAAIMRVARELARKGRLDDREIDALMLGMKKPARAASPTFRSAVDRAVHKGAKEREHQGEQYRQGTANGSAAVADSQ